MDEYQDLNQAQYELLRLLAPADHTNLFVIGDPNQAIYGFRGAQPKYFHQLHPGLAPGSNHFPGRNLSPALPHFGVGPKNLWGRQPRTVLSLPCQ